MKNKLKKQRKKAKKQLVVPEEQPNPLLEHILSAFIEEENSAEMV